MPCPDEEGIETGLWMLEIRFARYGSRCRAPMKRGLKPSALRIIHPRGVPSVAMPCPDEEGD